MNSTICKTLDLEVNLSSSWVFAPAWAYRTTDEGIPTIPHEFTSAIALFPNLSQIKMMHSTTILGCPFGTPTACKAMLNTHASDINTGFEIIKNLTKGKTHYQMIKYCILSRYQHMQRTLALAWTAEPAGKIDEAAFKALTEFGGWDENMYQYDLRGYWGGKLIVQSPYEQGGFGLTPLEDISTSAYYSLWASFFRWCATELPEFKHASRIQTSGAQEPCVVCGVTAASEGT